MIHARTELLVLRPNICYLSKIFRYLRFLQCHKPLPEQMKFHHTKFPFVMVGVNLSERYILHRNRYHPLQVMSYQRDWSSPSQSKHFCLPDTSKYRVSDFQERYSAIRAILNLTEQQSLSQEYRASECKLRLCSFFSILRIRLRCEFHQLPQLQ